MSEAILRFHQGTLTLQVDSALASELQLGALPLVYDERVDLWRAHANAYRDVFSHLHRVTPLCGVRLEDRARAYTPLALRWRDTGRHPRDYQRAALDAWVSAGRQGTIVLPTGAGKSYVAHLLMENAARSTLIVVPTIDLMHQWYSGLLDTFALDEVGLLGGGAHDLRPVTITTYDSACLHMERYGDRFGLLLCDEVHHLPGPTYQLAALACLAPFRAGLTATPERQDGGETRLASLVGPVVYRREIKELAGHYLADYDTERVEVELDEDEALAYAEARARYTSFLRESGVSLEREGWAGFLRACTRSERGREALLAWRIQRAIPMTCRQKLAKVSDLLLQHRHDRTLLFTHDNATVYELSRRHLLPAITHQTPVRERKALLAGFRQGRYPALITSKVLNEGVDVPEANVAIVLSGSGSVREHVQRLGRVLRKSGDKRARLYEVITRATTEEHVSERRREHDAYR